MIIQRRLIGIRVLDTCQKALKLLLVRKGDMTKSDLLRGLPKLFVLEVSVGEEIRPLLAWFS